VPSGLTAAAGAFVWPVWDRPGLPSAERRLLTLACVGTLGTPMPIDVHLYGALAGDELTLLELQEFIVHLALHCGFSRANVLDTALQAQWARRQTELGLDPSWPGPPEARFSKPDESRLLADEVFEAVHGVPPPAEPGTPFVEVGVMAFGFGNVWRRPGLTRRQRRLISIGCDGALGALASLHTHIRGALRAGDLSKAELDEVVLHFAIYSGFSRASAINEIVEGVWREINAGGGPTAS
jgi:4-carboxymuconolactone decarboxylase